MYSSRWENSFFLMDFIVMDMEEDTEVPLLLGRLFLAIGVALIDVKKGELTLKVGEEAVHFNLNKSLNSLNVKVHIIRL